MWEAGNEAVEGPKAEGWVHSNESAQLSCETGCFLLVWFLPHMCLQPACPGVPSVLPAQVCLLPACPGMPTVLPSHVSLLS